MTENLIMTAARKSAFLLPHSQTRCAAITLWIERAKRHRDCKTLHQQRRLAKLTQSGLNIACAA